jgi:hypothetical protein
LCIIDSPGDIEVEEETDAIFEFKLDQIPESAAISWYVLKKDRKRMKNAHIKLSFISDLDLNT